MVSLWKKTEGCISTFVTNKCRKVTEDVEANNQSATHYIQICIFKKMYELKRLEKTGLLSQTEIPVTGLERQKLVVTLLLLYEKSCAADT